MNNAKKIFELLHLQSEQSFQVTKPLFEGIFRLTDNLYIQKQISENKWESSQFQLCDLFNGTIDIKPINK